MGFGIMKKCPVVYRASLSKNDEQKIIVRVLLLFQAGLKTVTPFGERWIIRMQFGTGYAYWEHEWSCDYIETVKKVSNLGFDVLEIGAAHLHDMSDGEIEKLKKTAKEKGIELVVNSGPSRDCDFASDDAAVRENALRFFRKVMGNMKKLGSRKLIGAMFSYWPSDFVTTDKEKAWELSIAGLKELSKTAVRLDVEISLEVLNRNETYILTDCAEAIEYVQRIGCPKVKILLDTYHMNIEEDNMYDAIRNAGDLLGHVHVGENNRKLPGTNHNIDWQEFGKALQDIGYNKAVVMEPFVLKGGSVGHDIRVWRDLSNGATTKELDENIRKSLIFLKGCCIKQEER